MDYTTNAPASRAVRFRRDYLASLIDEVAMETSKPRILSLACGHTREVGLSLAAQEGRLGEFLAMDQDPESLRVASSEYGRFGVKPLKVSVREFLKKPDSYGAFDLVYTAGLYDYLSHAVAEHLTVALFGLLKTNGRLLVANFLPDVHDVGYMESYMDWKLIYRDEKAMETLTGPIPSNRLGTLKVWREPNDNIVFLELTRD